MNKKRVVTLEGNFFFFIHSQVKFWTTSTNMRGSETAQTFGLVWLCIYTKLAFALKLQRLKLFLKTLHDQVGVNLFWKH